MILPDMADAFGGGRESIITGFDNPFASSAKQDPMAAFNSLSSKKSSAVPFGLGGGMSQNASTSSDPFASMSGPTTSSGNDKVSTLDSASPPKCQFTNPLIHSRIR